LEKLIIFSEAEIRALPLPSREQHQAFVEHLRDVHSWYKHLPLLTGGKFVVFLAPDAGEGYPSQHPHLCYGNTLNKRELGSPVFQNGVEKRHVRL
jgi:hypothetical protein